MAAVLLVLLTAILFFNIRVSLLAESREAVRETASRAAGVLEDTGSPQAVVERLEEPGVFVVVEDSDDTVLAATPGAGRLPEPEPFVRHPRVQRTEDGYLATALEPGGGSGATVEVYSPVPRSGLLLRRLLAVELAAVASMLVLIAVVAPSLASGALRPLRRVSAVAAELRRGNLKSRVNLPKPAGSRDEVGEVAASFDEMARSLEALFASERESKEVLQRFLANASHEIRTPLTSILGYLDVLEEGGDRDPENRRRAFAAMREEGERMSRLVEDLLVLARLGARREAPVQTVDLAELAREAAGNHPGAPIEVEAPSPVEVAGDPEALRQVASNLLSNAAKHTPPDKRIQVYVGCEGDVAVLRVSDGGAGISGKDLPHVFERFYKGENSQQGGTGLGLAIVKEAVESWNGTVEVESEPGAGATFTVRLPLQEKSSGTN